MSLRLFILGLAASFGFAWLSVVVIPYFKMRNLDPIAFEDSVTTGKVFFPKRAGRIADGAQIYAENGCYNCHTQLVRPTYAGNDMFQKDLGGLEKNANGDDTRRETNAYDFIGEKFAQIGLTRLGPDLSNLGRRVESKHAKGTAEAWLYKHLYDARTIPQNWQSTCPPHRFLFEKRRITGQPSREALDVETCEGFEIVPKSEARALVSYLMSLKKDHPVPAALDFAPKK